jgi:AcrR family transcriptional regulator
MTGLRARQQQQLRHRISTAALRLFGAQGFDATTVDEIADQAGISPRTFFRYFETKDTVVTGPYLEGFTRWEHAIADAVAGQPLIDVLRHASQKVLDLYASEPDYWDGHYALITQDPALRRRMTDIQAQLQVRAAAVLATRLGKAPDDLGTRIVAAAAMTAVGEAVRQWYDAGGRGQRRTVVDAAFDQLADVAQLLHLPVPVRP